MKTVGYWIGLALVVVGVGWLFLNLPALQTIPQNFKYLYQGGCIMGSCLNNSSASYTSTITYDFENALAFLAIGIVLMAIGAQFLSRGSKKARL